MTLGVVIRNIQTLPLSFIALIFFSRLLNLVLARFLEESLPSVLCCEVNKVLARLPSL